MSNCYNGYIVNNNSINIYLPWSPCEQDLNHGWARSGRSNQQSHLCHRKNHLFYSLNHVLHIEGKQNIEADALSRLVPFPTKQDTPPTMNNLEQTNKIERRE